MNEILEKYTCEIELLSPLHIGNGKELTPIDYFVRDNYVVVYNLSKLLNDDQNFCNGFFREVEAKNRTLFLDYILDEQKKNDTRYYLYTAEISETLARTLYNEIQRKGNRANIFEFIKTPQNQPYIPGSSIKGAIRTAISYSILKNNLNLKNELISKLWQEKGRIINKLIFQGENLDAKKDILRGVSISDSSSLPPDGNLKIEIAKRLSSRKILGFSNYYEVLKIGTKLTCEISIYSSLLKNLESPFEITKESIIRYCNEFSKDLIEQEITYFSNHRERLNTIINFYHNLKQRINNLKSNQCILCLGQGGGFYKKTIATLLENTQGFNYAEFIRRFGKRNQGRELQRTSRVILQENTVLGWVEVRYD